MAAMRTPHRDGPSLLREVQGERGAMELLELDLMVSTSIDTAGEALKTRPIDALIHTAGLAPSAAFDDIPLDEQACTFQARDDLAHPVGQQRTHPDRHGRNAILAKVHSHVGGHLVGAGLRVPQHDYEGCDG